MTLPYERSRAVIQAREFLVELRGNKALPLEVRDEALRLLRHYPSTEEVLRAAKIEAEFAGQSIWGAPVFGSPVE